MVALDQSIVATALPKLSSEFKALDQLTWIVSTYFLTQAGLMLFFGQVLSKHSQSSSLFFVLLVLARQANIIVYTFF